MIGKGAFAKVYLFTDIETTLQYAAKVISKLKMVKTRQREKVLNEISIHK